MGKNSRLNNLWGKHIKPFLKDPLFLSRWVSEYSRRPESRTTKWVNWGYRTPLDRDEYSGATFMFLEDIHLKIMPYRNSGFRATLLNADPDLERVIASAIADHDYERDLGEGVEDFIRSATQTIFHHTEVYYEIECERDTNGKVTKIKLHHIYSPSMKKVFGQYFQIINWGAAKHSQIRAGMWKIPSKKILHIRPPKELGGKRGVKRLLRRLVGLNKITPNFYLKAMEKNENVGFDFDLYVKERYLETAIVTKKFGWNQRDFRDKNILEYYSVHRLLLETNALAIIRKHMLAEFNLALKTKMNIDNEVQIENLPTEESVSAERQRLQKGDLEFKSIVEHTRY